MFRDVARVKQKLTKEECIAVLKQEKRGVLSVLGDDGYPYGIPMNFWYDEGNGTILFHGGKKGHKIDSIRHCDKASFCVYDQGFRREGEWAWNVKSVIIFGRIREMNDPARMPVFLHELGWKYTTDKAYVEQTFRESIANVLCLELIPEHMTGKLVNES